MYDSGLRVSQERWLANEAQGTYREKFKSQDCGNETSAWLWRVVGSRYDIALLRLSTKVKLNRYVALGALPPSGQVLPNKNRCYITGWGDTSSQLVFLCLCFFFPIDSLCLFNKLKWHLFQPVAVCPIGWSRPSFPWSTTEHAPVPTGGVPPSITTWCALAGVLCLAVRWV